MKYIKSKFVSFICVFCMICTALTSGMVIHAAEATPTVSIVMNTAQTYAEIKLNNVGIMIYSVQLTLNTEDENTEYTLTTQNKDAYGTIKTDSENKTITLYIDSTELMNGSEEISLASLKSDKKMNIGDTADITLLNRSMYPESYNDVDVEITVGNANPNPTKRPSNNWGGGGSNGGSTNRVPSIVTGQNPSQTTAPIVNSTSDRFADVSADHWAKDSIKYVTDKGLFNGTSDTTFEPESQMTRAMYVSVLSRFGTKIDSKWQIICNTPMKFDDIADGEWYSEPVAWAGGTGLVQGIGENMFGPNNSVTREQIAVMTVKFANLCGAQMTLSSNAIEFADEADISDWAVEAVHTAQQAGLLNGRENGVFAPKDTATRAEVAAILHRFCVLNP